MSTKANEERKISAAIDPGQGASEEKEQLTTAQVCETIRMQVHNMERSLRCPLCLSCFQSATMLSTCCHVYCLSCFRKAQPRNTCPVCQQRCSHRSRVPAPAMDDLVRAFKETARAFGLLPSVPDAGLALTQLPASASQPQSMAATFEQLQAARTFSKYTPASTAATIWQKEQEQLVKNHEKALLIAAVGKRKEGDGKTKATVPRDTRRNNNKHASKAIESSESDDRKPSTRPQRTKHHGKRSKESVKEALATTNATVPNAVDSSKQSPPQSLELARADTGLVASMPKNKKDCEDYDDEVFYTAQEEPPMSMEIESAPPTGGDSQEVTKETIDDALQDNAIGQAATTTDPSEPQPAQPDSTSNNIQDDSEHQTLANSTSRAENEPETSLQSHQQSEPQSTVGTGRADPPERHQFGVGDLVQVQPRTWPGVNLPGGVGRITAVHEDKESNHFRYDIRYVLGGRERLVDAIFCSTTDLPNMGRRKSDQAELVASRRLAQKQEDGVLPPLLLAKLKSEGFDVEGKIEPTAVTVAAAKKPSPLKKENEPPQPPVNNNRKRKSATENPRSRPKAKKRRFGESILSRVSSIASRKPQIAPMPVDLSDEEACATADRKYTERFEKAIQKSSLSLVTSSLSDAEARLVELLCRQETKIRVKMTQQISKQTTICIIPSDPMEPSTAKARTAKAMRAALLGIPLVSPDWVQTCLSNKCIVAPSTYLRSLPSKSDGKTSISYGIAQLAARSTSLLQNYSIYMCLPNRLQQDIAQLLKDAGTTLSSRLTPPAKGQTLLVLCGDTDHNVSPPVIKAVTKNPGGYKVVHNRWLFDSISRGSPITDLSSYAPLGAKGQSLWKLCQEG